MGDVLMANDVAVPMAMQRVEVITDGGAAPAL